MTTERASLLSENSHDPEAIKDSVALYRKERELAALSIHREIKASEQTLEVYLKNLIQKIHDREADVMRETLKEIVHELYNGEIEEETEQEDEESLGEPSSSDISAIEHHHEGASAINNSSFIEFNDEPKSMAEGLKALKEVLKRKKH